VLVHQQISNALHQVNRQTSRAGAAAAAAAAAEAAEESCTCINEGHAINWVKWG
jgi:hypothetical protein